MPQLFRPVADTIARVVLVAILIAPFALIGGAYALMVSPYTTNQSITRHQPVPFSHAHHVGGLGHRLPLLPHLGRDSGFRRHAADHTPA